MNRLKELRKGRKLTQEELTRVLNNNFKTNVTLRTLQNWEAGKTPIKSMPAQILADYFDVSVGYLLGYDSINYPKQIRLETLDNIIERLEVARVPLLHQRDAKSFRAGFEAALMIIKTTKELIEEGD